MPDLPALLEAAIGDTFATTFDGSDDQARAICERAGSAALRVIRDNAGELGWIARLRLRRLAKKIIARERQQLLTG